MKVLVLGAAGSVGQHLLRGGVERGHALTALVRSPGKLKAWESRVRIVKGDALDKDALEQAVRGQDASIYALGTKRWAGRHCSLNLPESSSMRWNAAR